MGDCCLLVKHWLTIIQDEIKNLRKIRMDGF